MKILALALALIFFIISLTWCSDQDFRGRPLPPVPKPWIDPVPAPDDPVDPTEPYPGPRPLPEPRPLPLPFTPRYSQLLKLIEELREEIKQVKRRVSTLEALLNNQGRSSSKPSGCNRSLELLRDAMREFQNDGGLNIVFDGSKAPFQTLVDRGYLSKIPVFWNKVRGKVADTLSCLP
jgi:hypothetical protein